MRAGVTASITLGLLALVCGGGCGGGVAAANLAKAVPVKGKVTYKGQPLTQGHIKFEPEDTGREAHGNIQPDGTFVLSTFTEGDGAVTGTHRVAVTGGAGRLSVPIKYRSPSSSTVEVEVGAGKAEYPIDLE